MFKLKWNRPHFWMLCWTKVHSDQEKASSGRNQQQGEVLKARPLGNWHAYFKHPYYSKINYSGGPRKSLPNNYLWTIPTMWNTGVQVYMRKVVTHYNILTRNMLSVFCIKLACCKMQQSYKLIAYHTYSFHVRILKNGNMWKCKEKPSFSELQTPQQTIFQCPQIYIYSI